MTWGWRKILQLRPFLRDFLWYKIGDGSSVLIWYDQWCSISPLDNLISTRDIYRAGLTTHSKVSDIFHMGNLIWPHELTSKYPSLASVTGPCMTCSRDQLVWRDRLGNIQAFSIKEVWQALRPMDVKVDWAAIVWFNNCIPRHAFNLWLIIKKRLRTQDMLSSWDISGSLATNCTLCDLQPDSHEHLFFECNFSKLIWGRVKDMAGLNASRPSIHSIVSDIIPYARRRTIRSTIAKLVVAATAYFIWQERNYRLFKKGKRSEDQLVDGILSSVRFKLLSCRFKRSRDSLALLRLWKISDSVLDGCPQLV